MRGDLIIVHRTGSDPLTSLGEASTSPEVVVWETCLRQMIIGHSSDFQSLTLQPGDELLSDRRAYEFLLEVLCGLHSKNLGENEIVGQFKKRFHQSLLPPLFKSRFDRLFQCLLSDMKQVRTKHPLNSGVHSYGSFVRKAALHAMPVTIIGTGELALSILPWVLKENESVRVLYRSDAGRERISQDLRESVGKISFQSLAGGAVPFFGTLVIAAPISAAEMLRHFSSSGSEPTQIIDFRRECESDPIREGTVTLHDFFRHIKDTGLAGSLVRIQAIETIRSLASARYDGDFMQIRTGGWEDLCG